VLLKNHKGYAVYEVSSVDGNDKHE